MPSFDAPALDELLSLASASALADIRALIASAGSTEELISILNQSYPRLIEEASLLSAAAAREIVTESVAAAGIKAPRGWEKAWLADDISDTEAVKTALKWAMSPLFDDSGKLATDDVSGVRSRLLVETDRLAKQPTRNVVYSASKQLGKTGKTRYYRAPQGDTCAFCLLMASRGPVYATARDAGGEGNKYHGKCNCLIVMMHTGDEFIEGYDLRGYEAAYRDAQQAGASKDMAHRPGAQSEDVKPGLREALRNIRGAGFADR